MQKSESRYLKVKRYILDGIREGKWTSGEQVPSENELVSICSVSRMTARRALEELNSEGILYRIRGKGSFVAEEKHQSSLLAIRNIKTEIKEQGHEHRVSMMEMSEIPASVEMRELFSLPEGANLFHSIIVHYQDDMPIQVEERFINPNVAADYLKQDFKTTTPNEYLTSVAPVTEAEHLIEAIVAEKQINNLLNLEADEAVLLLTRTTWSFEKAVSFAKLYHPGKRYRLGTRFTPDN
ncbi:histidine utilization repressor [Pleionea sp. CnH1-48]|uniref:histidine utilization repressor n=1 Tax=Pleionea sp. CnH1-48 TaxID=2954494 RepID=UPI002096972C|nr:histidine utilization repressor [Pleionea sp. CnH1-48]MCO7227144.1 histidine utilization repressor [Pleionea sp. CnH1-48]